MTLLPSRQSPVQLPRPLLMVVLLATLTVTWAPSAYAQPEGMRCADEPTDMLVEYGNVIACSIDPADSDLYRLPGLGGEIVDLSLVYGGEGAGRTCVTLYTDGTKIAEHCPFNAYSSRMNVQLPFAGTYTLEVRSSNSSGYTYALAIERLAPASPSAKSPPFGQTLSDSIDPKGDIDYVTMLLSSGDSIVADLTFLSGTGRTCLELWGTTVSPIATACQFNQYRSRIERKIDATGVYVFRISSSHYYGDMRYGFTIQCTGSCRSLSVPRLRLSLTQCSQCLPGSLLSMRIDVENPLGKKAELKASYVLSDGRTGALGNKHWEVAAQSTASLDAAANLPTTAAAGDALACGRLIDVRVGHTVAVACVPFAVLGVR